MDSITIKVGYENMDFPEVTEMLAKTLWSPGIKIDEVKKGAANSALVVGAFTDAGMQVGYARVISDKTRFAYLCDVIVQEDCRKKGIGQAMVNHILAHEELKDVYQWLLVTNDAHGVYEKSGFKPISRPEGWMEIRQRRPER